MLFETFYPDTWVDSTYQIDFDELYKKGYRGLIFDIDNTLVPHGEPANERAKALFAHLKELGFSCCLLSNNQLERVQMSNTMFIGDQLFTDVYGAKRTGMANILVKPIHPKEEIQIVLKRYLEKIVLHFYQKNRKSGRI